MLDQISNTCSMGVPWRSSGLERPSSVWEVSGLNPALGYFFWRKRKIKSRKSSLLQRTESDHTCGDRSVKWMGAWDWRARADNWWKWLSKWDRGIESTFYISFFISRKRQDFEEHLVADVGQMLSEETHLLPYGIAWDEEADFKGKGGNRCGRLIQSIYISCIMYHVWIRKRNE